MRSKEIEKEKQLFCFVFQKKMGKNKNWPLDSDFS